MHFKRTLALHLFVLALAGVASATTTPGLPAQRARPLDRLREYDPSKPRPVPPARDPLVVHEAAKDIREAEEALEAGRNDDAFAAAMRGIAKVRPDYEHLDHSIEDIAELSHSPHGHAHVAHQLKDCVTRAVVAGQSLFKPHDECPEADQIEDEELRTAFREVLADIKKSSAP
jgi:hypothetical protein